MLKMYDFVKKFDYAENTLSKHIQNDVQTYSIFNMKYIWNIVYIIFQQFVKESFPLFASNNMNGKQ